MRVKMVNVLFFAVVLAVIFGYAFEHQIRSYFHNINVLQLTDIKLETIAGAETTIPKGMAGYVVFYSDLTGCTACLRKLGDFNTLMKVYDEVGFFAVVKEQKAKQPFAELMAEYEVPGEYFVDVEGSLENRLKLGDHPMLLFFNRDERLIAMLPLDVEYEKLLRQYHIFIAEM